MLVVVVVALVVALVVAWVMPYDDCAVMLLQMPSRHALEPKHWVTRS